MRQLVELHGGTVRAESGGRGTGSTLEVRLPSGTPAKREGPATAMARSEDSRSLEGVRVLVVDDDEDALELMSTTFASHGAMVDAATSAREAMQLFERAAPDVIVSDIGMPFEDGYALMKRVRQRSPAAGGRVPAVALTAYASPSDRLAALSAGYQAHVSKPYEPADVVALVARLARETIRS